VSLTVRAEAKAAERCFEVSALQQRIAHYGEAKLARARELRLELQVDAGDTAELFVYRGSTLVARRRFGGLPEACADRRDMVALSIALALEGVIRELEPGSDTGATSATSSTSGAARATQGAADASASAATQTAAGVDEGRAAGEGDRAAQPVAAPARDEREQDDERADEVEAHDVPSDDHSASELSIAAHLGGRFLVSALPSLTWTAELGTELWIDRTFGVGLAGLASTRETSNFVGGVVETRLVGGALLGCYAFELDPLAAHGCIGVGIAAAFARGRDYPVAFPDATLLWSAGLGQLAVRWPAAEPVSVRLVIQAHANFVRPTIHVAGSSDELSPFWWGGSGGLDLVVSLD
jgi:hypothetical protein